MVLLTYRSYGAIERKNNNDVYVLLIYRSSGAIDVVSQWANMPHLRLLLIFRICGAIKRRWLSCKAATY